MPIAPGPVKTSIEVEKLGKLLGWANEDGTTSFYGVPYADIAARFRDSTPKESWEGGEHDGTKLAGYSPQPKRPFYPFPMPDREHLNESVIDEFNMLNLHITLPKGCQPTDKLPVFVFIHGGGFVFGTANYSILDGRPLAVQSFEYDMPTIIITLNYRVGMYGFLASEDIKLDNVAAGFTGNGNQGLIDQRNALIWIHKHIHNFGGDPSRVTLSGQSAGAISVDMHVWSEYNNLFSTAIYMSGSIPICGTYTEAEYNNVYFKLLIACGIDTTLPSTQRLAALRAISHEVISKKTYEVFENLNLPQFGPCRDFSFIGQGVDLPYPHTYAQEKLPYKGKMVFGDCQHEGIIYDQAFRDYSYNHLIDKIKQYMPSDLIPGFVQQYQLHPSMSKRDLYIAQEKIVTDGLFTATPYFMAQNNPTASVYHWDHASQFDNPWGGFAHHSLDYMWLFGGLKAILTPEENTMSRTVARHFLSFANGIDPYPSYGEDKNCMVYGPHSVAHQEKAASYSLRSTDWFERVKEHMDEFDKLCHDLIIRRPRLVDREFIPETIKVDSV